jgi:outer membrane protein OmpA-like peptidoglycan-associated protein
MSTTRSRIWALTGAAFLLAGCTSHHDVFYPDHHPWRVTHVGQETDYELLDAVLFDSGSADISHRAFGVIADIAVEARNRSGPVIVEGYTDTVGSAENNLELSRARAQHVADILVHEGVLPRRISIHGFGETYLAVPTPDQVDERRNRRVVIRILPPG